MYVIEISNDNGHTWAQPTTACSGYVSAGTAYQDAREIWWATRVVLQHHRLGHKSYALKPVRIRRSAVKCPTVVFPRSFTIWADGSPDNFGVGPAVRQH
jgi:hypothetical protein